MRDSLIRYFGFVNEVGESFRHAAPWFVKPSYTISISYVLCDSMHKSYRAYKQNNFKYDKFVSISFLDALIW